MVSQATTDEESSVRVRVWFGELPIVDHTMNVTAGTDFAQAMGRRFFGLPVTVESVAGQATVTDTA